MSEDKISYVYMYINPLTNTPFYVGMGKNERYLQHLREAKSNRCGKQSRKINTIKKILLKGLEPQIIKIALKRAEEGNHPFQSAEYRKRKSDDCKEKNHNMNKMKSQRKNVAELKEIYTKLKLKQPRGGIWVKQDDWINGEIDRLNNPFGDL